MSTMGRPLTDIRDLVTDTLPFFKDKGEFEAVLQRQSFPVNDDWFQSDRLQVSSGNSVEWRVIFGNITRATKTRLDAEVSINMVDHFRKGSVPWTMASSYATWNEQQASMMKGEAELVNYLKGEYYVGKLSLMEVIERDAFAVPYNSSDDTTAFGVPYWAPFLDTGTKDYTGGYNAKTFTYGDGTTSTTHGGLDWSLYPEARSWGGNYSGVVDMTLVDAIRLFLSSSRYRLPRGLKQYARNAMPRRRIYSDIARRTQYVNLVNARPADIDNADLNPFKSEGVVTLDGVEWIEIPEISNLSYSPIYCLDNDTFMPFVLDGWWWAESEVMKFPNRAWTAIQHYFCQYNFISTNPRKLACWHTPN